MARLLRTPFGLRVALDGPVGKTGGNGRSDVAVVQLALRVVFSASAVPRAGVQEGQRLKMPGPALIGVDGGYGPETSDFIDAYQEHRKLIQGPGGMQLPPPIGSFAGRTGGAGWSFSVLDGDAAAAVGQPFVDQLAMSPFAPAWLKGYFFGT